MQPTEGATRAATKIQTVEERVGKPITKRESLALYQHVYCKPCGAGCPIGSLDMTACVRARVRFLNIQVPIIVQENPHVDPAYLDTPV